MKTSLKIYLILFLAFTLPMALLAQTTVSMPVNVAGAVYTVTKPTAVTLGIITVTSPTGSAYTYSLDGGTFQSSPIFSGLADNTTHTITVKTTDNNTLSTTPPILVVLCDNDISSGTGTIAKMLYDNTGSGTATYNWCAREVTGPDGLQWLDRNLGAYQVATSSTDAQSYGSMYQWGRNTDGHQLAGSSRGVDVGTSSTTTVLATSDVPGNGNFITNSTAPRDWRSDNNNNRWNLTSGSGATFTQANNPCPNGYHVPTHAQQVNLYSAGNITNASSAYNTSLKLSEAGDRKYDGTLENIGTYGQCWASTPSGTDAYAISFFSFNVTVNTPLSRAYGSSIRCIKN